MGVLQGLTEFLPVSSSGHLVIAQELLNWRGPHLEFDIAVHGGTLLAILVVFRSEIGEVLRKPLQRRTGLILAASLPTAVSGLAVHLWGKGLFASAPFAALMLLGTGVLLWLTRGRVGQKELEGTGFKEALLVGLGQAVAVLPGVSRSGTTISIALLLGLRRQWAGEFSFLVAIPAMAGALILEARGMVSASPQSLLVGAAWAFVSGLLALKVLLGLIKRGRFHLFAPYCWMVGGGYLLYRLLG